MQCKVYLIYVHVIYIIEYRYRNEYTHVEFCISIAQKNTYMSRKTNNNRNCTRKLFQQVRWNRNLVCNITFWIKCYTIMKTVYKTIISNKYFFTGSFVYEHHFVWVHAALTDATPLLICNKFSLLPASSWSIYVAQHVLVCYVCDENMIYPCCVAKLA